MLELRPRSPINTAPTPRARPGAQRADAEDGRGCDSANPPSPDLVREVPRYRASSPRSIKVGSAEVPLLLVWDYPGRTSSLDHQYEGHIICVRQSPQDALPLAANLDLLAERKRGEYLDLLMSDSLACGSSALRAPDDRTTRILVPGLNTRVREAAHRNRRYAESLGLRIAQMHNGSEGDLPGRLGLQPKYNDWENAVLSRFSFLRRTLGVLPAFHWRSSNSVLVNHIQTVLMDSIDQRRPIELLVYSDATIVAGIAIEQLFRRYRERHPRADLAGLRTAFSEALRRHVTVVAFGPAWSNYRVRMSSSSFGLRRVPDVYANTVEVYAWGEPARGQSRDVLTERFGSRSSWFKPSPQNDGVVSVCYPSPYPGFQAHNLPLHVAALRAILDRSGVRNFAELHAAGRRGELGIPSERELLTAVLADYDACVRDRYFWGARPLARPLLKLTDARPEEAAVVHVEGRDVADEVALAPGERLVLIGTGGDERVLFPGEPDQRTVSMESVRVRAARAVTPRTGEVARPAAT